MFANSRKIAIIGKLCSKNNTYGMALEKNSMAIHTSSCASNYVLPIPNNIDPAETTRFSPNRARDISATVILSQYGAPAAFDITADNSANSDPHTESYDCFGAVSLSCQMQSNVPTPFGGMHKFSHLNMPGGQWSQEPKFTSQNLQNSHYTALRENVRAGWASYNQDATVHKKSPHHIASILSISKYNAHNVASTMGWCSALSKRSYCNKVETTTSTTTTTTNDEKLNKLSKKEQLKRAFTDYGATVLVFHVSISLLSLGGCYLLVSGGIDLMPILDYFGLSSSALTNKIATGASTFVIAYAIHKVFAPVRISITLGATPFIVRYLRSKGILKVKNVKT